MNCIAFIPVRCGSKSIPFKNIKPFCNQPLVYWNLQELENIIEVKKIVIATDCDEIENTVKRFNFSKVIFYRRGSENATDGATTESVMHEYIKYANLQDSDVFMLVQATSPLTTRDDFYGALSHYQKGGFDSMLSCVRQKRFIWTDDGKALNYDISHRPRRQEFAGFLLENGAFYINRVKNIIRDNCRLSGNISCYVMPEYSFVEIDEEYDWIIAEGIMRKYFPYFPKKTTTIKLLATDVDGVLTDAGMYYSELGDELKKFNTRDGKGFEILRLNNIKTAIITSEDTKMVERRGVKLKVDYVIQGVSGIDKLKAIKMICSKENFHLDECAYIGDDINCIPVLEQVGYPFCPSDAEVQVKSVKNIVVLNRAGGRGVFREVVSTFITL